MAATLDELVVADAADAWRACGFAVDGDVCVVGEVGIRFAPQAGGHGLSGWSLRGLDATELDGLQSSCSEGVGFAQRVAPAHPNGVTALDHVVAISPTSTAPLPRSRQPAWTCAE